MLKRSLFVTIGIILIMNAVLLMRVGDLTNRIEGLSHNYNSLQSSIHSVTGNVNHSLNQFVREQSWITPIQIDEDKTKSYTEQGQAVLNWQIKDFQDGSQVMFHYRQPGDGEFQTITAKAKGTGLFEVQVPIEVIQEPIWDVRLVKTGENQSAQQAVEEHKQADQTIQCYVSVKTGNNTRSCEINDLNFNYIASMKYEPVRGHVHVDKNQYNITLFEDDSGNNSFQSLSAAFYNGEKLIAERPIEVQQVVIQEQKTVNAGNDRHIPRDYHLSYNAGSDSISRIVLHVKYQNGDTFAKEFF